MIIPIVISVVILILLGVFLSIAVVKKNGGSEIYSFLVGETINVKGDGKVCHNERAANLTNVLQFLKIFKFVFGSWRGIPFL